MASIPASQARARFTQKLAATFSDFVPPMSFMRSFFTEQESLERYISIEVQRLGEPVAVDVARGTNGNYNKADVSTEKVIDPPYYHEWFAITELRLYDAYIASAGMGGVTFARLIQQANEKLKALRAKIDRAYERQCAQVFETGVVTLENDTNIDFKRKAASLVNVNTNTDYSDYWNTSNGDPVADLLNACKFLREVGKATGGTFNLILGDLAFNALINNDKFKARADIKDYKMSDIQGPVRNSVGASLHGRVSVGSWNINLWGYPEVYNAPTTGTLTNYVNPRKVILLPETPNFLLSYGAVPQLIGDNGEIPQKGKYLISDFTDKRSAVRGIDLKSAGVAVPVGVDQIWTGQVVADAGS